MKGEHDTDRPRLLRVRISVIDAAVRNTVIRVGVDLRETGDVELEHVASGFGGGVRFHPISPSLKRCVWDDDRRPDSEVGTQPHSVEIGDALDVVGEGGERIQHGAPQGISYQQHRQAPDNLRP